MSKARSAHAAPAFPAGGIMQDGVVQSPAPGQASDIPRLQQSITTTTTPYLSAGATPNDDNNLPEVTRRDVHTASSINAQRRFPTPAAKEPNLAHQAALRRVKGKDILSTPAAEPQPATSSKPVLVRKPSSKTDMRRKQKPTAIDTVSRSPKLPPLESFSFQDILASIGPDVEASIDAIAEICGRSKMSLAEEHSSHRPPQGDRQNFQNSPADSVPPMRLDTVEETGSEGALTWSKSRRLALARGSHAGIPSGDATASASNINISSHNRAMTTSQTSLLPQILAWLRGHANDASTCQDDGATRALHHLRVLSDTASIRS